MDDDIFNSDNIDFETIESNRPRLKKVKRPVKKLVSSHDGMPVSPKAPSGQGFGQQTNQNNNIDDDFNLDAFLDNEGKDNVPMVNQNHNIFESETNFIPQFVSEQEIAEPKSSISEQFASGNFTTKAVTIIAIVLFIVGFGFAKMFFAEETVIRDGLQGVIINPEVPRGRARCGIAERTQGCVLYIMNPQRQDLNARDFYDLASQLTGRQRFVIETGNMRYSNVKIRPGNIAQLNIPPLQ